MRICNEKTNHVAEIVYDNIYDTCPVCDLISEYKDKLIDEMKINQKLRFKIANLSIANFRPNNF